MLNCRSCSFFKSYFAVILITAISVRFFPQYSPAITSLLLVGIPVLIYKKSAEELGFQNIKKGLIWGTAISLIILPFYYLFVPERNSIALNSFISLIPYYFGVALGEEVFFRGFFYSTFENENLVGSLLTKNNLVSSILFGIAHALIYYNPSMFKVFFPSLVMGFLYERSGSIVAPIVFHCFSDVVYQFARF
jgi:membrane protease YdiL (CAAX protease family)